MLEVRSIYQLEPYYYPEFKKYIFKDDIRFHFGFDVPKIDIISKGNIFADSIKANSIHAENLHVNFLNSKKIISKKIKCVHIFSDGLVKADEIIARSIHTMNISSDHIIVSDIISRYIKAKKLEYYTVCVATKHIDCPEISSTRKNHVCACLDYEVLRRKYE